MEIDKHTPGHWSAKKSNIPDNTGGYDWCITDESMAIISEVFQNIGYAKDESDYPYNQRPVEANARLIATSPKLLSACQAAYSQMLQMPHDMLRDKSQNALAELRDSIAQALNLEPEYVQNSYEQAVIEARKS